ncbi:MAG: Spy/CpxP family protein refolding chaperone [Acidobacteriota bacterium]
MKTRIVVIAVVVGALAVGSAGWVAAQGAHGKGGMRALAGGPGPLGPLGRALRHLDLTQEQKDAIKAIVEADRESLQSLREQVRAKREAYREAHPPDTFDEAALRAHLADLAPLQAELAVGAAKLRIKVFAVLTAEQRAELAEMREDLEELGRHGGRGHGW